MSYLYGDSTPSPLKSNFIEFLGEALDFSVQILQSANRLQILAKRIGATKDDVDAEITRLEALQASVAVAMERTPKGAADSPAATCAIAILASATELGQKAAAAAKAKLAVDVAALEAQDGQERDGCERALEALLRLHDPPEATTTVQLVQRGAHYAATRAVETPFGLEYVMELEIASPHPFSQVARIDRFVSPLEIQAPEAGGWVRKEIKHRPQRLEKYYLSEMTFSAGAATLKIRASADGGTNGFDVEIRDEAPRVQIVRMGDPGEGGGAFDLSETDAAKLIELYEALQAPALEVEQNRTRLVEAKVDQRPFRQLSDPSLLVDRLVQAMAPVVQEIAQHSLAPGELILKRLVGDHRREEIFVSKAALDQKLAPLPEPTKSRFFALGLSPSMSRQPPPPPPESRARSIVPVQEPTVVVSDVEDADDDSTAAFLLAGRSS
jgi:hypothetical protein